MVAIISLSFNAGTVKSGDYIYDLLKENNFTSEEVYEWIFALCKRSQDS